MKTALTLIATALVLQGMLAPLGAVEHAARRSSHVMLESKGGFIAHSLRFLTEEGDPEGRTFIEKEGLVIATLKGVRAVSFSPVDDILLVREDLADDDNRHYLLNIGAGEYSRTDPREGYVIGSRMVTRAEWSEDGLHLVLFDHPGITGNPPEVVVVADKLAKNEASKDLEKQR